MKYRHYFRGWSKYVTSYRLLPVSSGHFVCKRIWGCLASCMLETLIGTTLFAQSDGPSADAAVSPQIVRVDKHVDDDAAEPSPSVTDTDSHGARAAIEVQGAILKTIESTALAAQLSGAILELNVREGDTVAAGQELGKIRDEAVKLKLDQLKTQVLMMKRKQANDINKRLAQKSQEVAENEYQRAITANARVPDTYPINEIDRLKLIADQARLEVERAIYESEIAKFEVDMAVSDYQQTFELYSRHRIVAPVSGVVVSLEKRPGEWVEPGVNVMQIVRIDRLRVEGFITASQAMHDLMGATAEVSFASAEAADDPVTASGTVVFISPDVNPVNSHVRVFMEIDNQNNQLRPGLRVSARIKDSKP